MDDNLQRLAQIPRKDLPDLRLVARCRLGEHEMPKGQPLDWAHRGQIFDLKAEETSAHYTLVLSPVLSFLCFQYLDRLI